jgi:lipid-A-disaccharide synthase
MKYFIIAGEPSGDLHGSNLILNLVEADPAADIVCWGGDLMARAGGRVLRHYRETAFMGVWEVMVNIRKVRRNFADCRRQIDELKPDVVILIDYPGFNLRMARYARKKGIRVYYYISPKFWAWREGRVKLLKKYVDRLYIIFPFETEFYRKHGYTAHFLGNPLIDQTEAWRHKTPEHGRLMESLGLGEKPVILLMSGSRLQEISKVLPGMIQVVSLFPEYQFVVAGMEHLPASLYEGIIGTSPVRVVNDRAYDLLSVAEAALVTSGTATLEAALFGVPQVVCYRTSSLTYAIGRFFLKVRYISLVNLIMGREAVAELIQGEMRRERLRSELEKIIPGGERRESVKRDYEELRQRLGGEGASARIASDMVTQLKQGSIET